MNVTTLSLLGGLVFWVILDLVGIYVSKAKNRPAIEGFMLTLVLGLLGILIAAVLPTKGAPAPVVQVAAKKRYPKGTR